MPALSRSILSRQVYQDGRFNLHLARRRSGDRRQMRWASADIPPPSRSSFNGYRFSQGGISPASPAELLVVDVRLEQLQ